MHGRGPADLTELERFYNGEWQKMLLSRDVPNGLLPKKRLSGVIKSKGALTEYSFRGLHTYATRSL